MAYGTVYLLYISLQVNAAREKEGDEEDVYDEPYFSEEGEDDATSLVEVPAGILGRYEKERQRKRTGRFA